MQHFRNVMTFYGFATYNRRLLENMKKNRSAIKQSGLKIGYQAGVASSCVSRNCFLSYHRRVVATKFTTSDILSYSTVIISLLFIVVNFDINRHIVSQPLSKSFWIFTDCCYYGIFK